jgi:GT2 family glycosyltransferase
VPSRLTIAIVSYNTAEVLAHCLASIEKARASCEAEGLQLETWVIDNASRDGSAQMVARDFPSVHLIESPENLGFGRANNLVFAKTRDEYVLVLNPDTEIGAQCLLGCRRFADEHRDVGILGCRVVLPDGTLDRACKRGIPTPLNALCYFTGLDRLFPRHPVIGGYNATYVAETEQADVGAVVGAFMWIRREALDAVGGFDEEFFMYGEDLDLCYRFTQAGWRVVYVPRYEVRHHKGVSSGIKDHSARQSKASLSDRVRMAGEFHDAMLTFYNKHHRGRYPKLVDALVLLAVRVRRWFAVRRVRGRQ